MTTTDEPAAPRLYRRIPSLVLAVQWRGGEESKAEVTEFAGGRVEFAKTPFGNWSLELLAGPGGQSGWTFVPHGAWIAKDPEADDFWPIAASAFAKYEPVE